MMIVLKEEYKPDQFFIDEPVLEHEAGIVKFRYAYDEQYSFEETIDFGKSLPTDKDRADSFIKAINQLNIALAISYYKAFLPEEIKVTTPVSENTLAIFKDMYRHGLGEFAYRNQLSLKDKLNFSAPHKDEGTTATSLARKSAVLIGGGKDSNVSIEILKASNESMVLFAVNPAKPILNCAEKSGVPLISIKRTLSPLLFELNDKGAYNGHVPITGIIIFIAAAASFVHDFDNIILSNERSAEEGNATYEGEDINRQFSKSLAFEKRIDQHIQTEINPNLKTFSLLRPLSELHIAALFAKKNTYDDIFTSCNKAFKIKDKPDTEWCRDCPKCRFVFLILATIMPLDRVVKIFGGNILEDETQLQGYRDLVGLSTNKPWECVGEYAESATAFYLLSKKDDFEDNKIVNTVLKELAMNDASYESLYADFMTPSSTHNLSKTYLESLDAYLEG